MLILVTACAVFEQLLALYCWIAARDGKKDNPDGTVIPQEPDAMTCEKAKSAVVFREAWKEARQNIRYLQMKKEFRENKS